MGYNLAMADKPPKNINFPPDDQMNQYLDLIIKKGGFGKSNTEVARRLVWESIRNLVRDGWIPSDPPNKDGK